MNDELNEKIDVCKNFLQAARAEVNHVGKLITRVETQRAKVMEELTKLEEKRGEVVMIASENGKESEAIKRESRKITLKRDELETSGDVIRALQNRLAKGKQAVIEARAACFQAEADVLLSQAEEREVKTNQLLAELEEWEGVRYQPPQPPPVPIPPAGVYADFKIVMVPVPYSQIIRKRAQDFQTCASCELDGRPYPKNIYGDGPELPEYLAGSRE